MIRVIELRVIKYGKFIERVFLKEDGLYGKFLDFYGFYSIFFKCRLGYIFFVKFFRVV